MADSLTINHWHPTAAYLYTLPLDGPALAWEYLRRNPDYRLDWLRRYRHPDAAHRWGLHLLEDPALDEEEEVNEADLKNDVYITLSEGLELELLIYLPMATEYQGVDVPASTMKIIFSVDDLDRFFPFEERERIARALRVVYYDFFDTASPAEVQQAEADWDWIGHRIMSSSRWAVRHGLSPEVRNATLDLQFGGQSIDVLQEMFPTSQRLEFAETLLWSDAQVVVNKVTPVDNAAGGEFSFTQSTKAVAEINPISAGNNPTPPYVTLTWSNEVYSKAIKVRSAVTQRGDVRMQVKL